MNAIPKDVTIIWLALVGLTFVSLFLGERGSPSAASYSLVLGLIVLACVKVRMVILHFMEIKEAPLLLRGVLEFWVVGVGVMLVVMYRA